MPSGRQGVEHNSSDASGRRCVRGLPSLVTHDGPHHTLRSRQNEDQVPFLARRRAASMLCSSPHIFGYHANRLLVIVRGVHVYPPSSKRQERIKTGRGRRRLVLSASPRRRCIFGTPHQSCFRQCGVSGTHRSFDRELNRELHMPPCAHGKYVRCVDRTDEHRDARAR